MKNISNLFTVHKKFIVGTEKNYQGNLNCATVLHGLCYFDNDVHEELFKR